MPTYEWRCPRCGKEFEMQMSMKEADEYGKECDCGENCERLIVNGNFILRGEGWPSKDLRKGIDE